MKQEGVPAREAVRNNNIFKGVLGRYSQSPCMSLLHTPFLLSYYFQEPATQATIHLHYTHHDFLSFELQDMT